MKRLMWLAFVIAVGCATGPPQPAPLRIGEDACGQCRMTIVAVDTAAQIVEPGAEPLVFDDIGCLQKFLASSPASDRAVVFVADHHTHDWVDSAGAVFTRTSVATPMSSGLLAHANAASRDADPAARGGTPVAADAILGSRARSARP